MQIYTHSVPRRVLLKGLIAFLLVYYLALVFRAPVIQEDIKRRARQALTRHDANVSATVSGRDISLVSLDNDTAELIDARQVAKHVLGVRKVSVEMNTRLAVEKILKPVTPVVARVANAEGILLRTALENTRTTKPAKTKSAGGEENITGEDTPPVETGAAETPSAEDAAAATPAMPQEAPAPPPALPPASSPMLAKGKLDIHGVRFLRNTSRLTNSSLPKLKELIGLLHDHPSVNIEIGGYTDSWGNKAYNLKLSRQRANAVRAYLIKQGIQAGRLTARGYGEARPIASNRTERGRRMNRRIEFVVTTN